MLREITSWLAVLLLTGAVCGFAWLTRHPETPWLETAEEWPLAGPLAERFRRAYLGPPPDERAAERAAAERDGAPAVGVPGGEAPDRPLDLTGDGPYSRSRFQSDATAGTSAGTTGGSREEKRQLAAFDLPDLAEAVGGGDTAWSGESTVSRASRSLPGFALPPPPRRTDVEREWLLPGTVLRSDLAASATEVERARELASVPVLERRGEWLLVRLRGREGWADPATPATEVGRAGVASFAGRYAARPRGDVVREVEKRLDLRKPNGRLGPFPLYSDVQDAELLALLGSVAERLDEAYGARYGLGLPRHRARPQIALFATEADFRALAGAIPGAPLHVRGFAPGGLVVFYVGDDPWPLVVSGFVHELTHTLNRLALGSSLPPWLEEGLAEDLGGIWIEEPGAPSPLMTHPGDGRRHGWGMQDMVAAVAHAGSSGTPRPRAELVALDRTGFFGFDAPGHYTQSQLFVRCLLDGGEPALADGFRRFLSDTATGYRPEPRALIDRLGRDWSEIERTCDEHRVRLAEEIRSLLPEGAFVAGIR